jgi:hypothetical protein
VEQHPRRPGPVLHRRGLGRHPGPGGDWLAGDFTVRLISRPRTWTGGFTGLFVVPSNKIDIWVDTSGNLSYYAAGVASGGLSIGGGMTAGGVWDFALTRIGSNLFAYVNGAALNGGAAFSVGATGTGATSAMSLGGADGGTTFDGDYALFQSWNRALSAGEIAAAYADPYALFLPPATRRFYSYTTGGAGSAAVAFSATLADQTLAASVTTAAPPSRTVAFAATLADQSFSGSIAAAAPASRTVTFAASVGDVTLAATMSSAAVPEAIAAFAATVADVTFSATTTAAAPPSRTVAFSTALGDAALAVTMTPAAPGTIVVAFAGALAAQSFAASITTAAPPSRAATFAATLADAAFSGTATSSAVGAATVAFAAAVGPATFAASVVRTGGTDPGTGPTVFYAIETDDLGWEGVLEGGD